jgi:hypothetical protein
VVLLEQLTLVEVEEQVMPEVVQEALALLSFDTPQIFHPSLLL